MLFVFGTIIIIASVILGIIILIQNPKGGGLTSSLGGFGNQLMGVKQTTDVLEKGTWLFAVIIAVLCVTSALFIPKAGGTNSRENLINEAPVGTPLAPQNNTAPLPVTPQQQAPAPKK
jgi:preprotein translocase subunit SecG